MAKKEFTFKGKTVQELEKISLEEYANLVPARQRRSLNSGFSEAQKKLLMKVKKAKQGTYKKIIKTHCRDMVVIPEMISLTIHVYDGKSFHPVYITEKLLGHYLGEFVLTRRKVQHSAPGIGATKSSSAVSVK